jgi:8-oxo-dGTP pyrophosphatase MutT (NUDIX family)
LLHFDDARQLEQTPGVLDFSNSQAKAAPRDAATVVPLRDAAGGLEVFSVLRHPKSGFLGGALVFPGGKLDATDADEAWARLAASPAPERSEAFATATAGALALAVCACREAFEEASLLPALRGGAAVAADEIDELRAGLGDGRDLAARLAARGVSLAFGALVPFARWITPEAEARRFDARFFLLEMPPGQVGRHDGRETTHGFWATPADVLQRAAAGEFFLAPPTSRALELLSATANVAEAARLAARQSLAPICPTFVADPVAPFLALPGDPAHAVGERRVDGPSRYVLREGRFVAEDPPPA